MSKADLPIPSNPLTFQVVGGVDESVQETDTDFGFSAVSGVIPFYTGSHNRLFGKKLIDNNPGQSVMAIAQAFNGYGQFGYFVQTTFKLYYHVCETPADLFINYALPTTLGVDENGFTLDIFGQANDGSLPQDSQVPCVFQFPDKPAPIPDQYFVNTEFNNWSCAYEGQTERKGMVLWRVTGGTGSTSPDDPYTIEEVGRWHEGTDFPIPDFDVENLLNISTQILFYPGSQQFFLTIWFENADSTRVTYQCPLQQIIRVGSVGINAFNNQYVAYPTDDPRLYFCDGFLGGVSIPDTTTANGTLHFALNS
jgi:hypothetical protein